MKHRVYSDTAKNVTARDDLNKITNVTRLKLNGPRFKNYLTD